MTSKKILAFYCTCRGQAIELDFSTFFSEYLTYTRI